MIQYFYLLYASYVYLHNGFAFTFFINAPENAKKLLFLYLIRLLLSPSDDRRKFRNIFDILNIMFMFLSFQDILEKDVFFLMNTNRTSLCGKINKKSFSVIYLFTEFVVIFSQFYRFPGIVFLFL